MVDLTFTSRAKHFIPLALLRCIAELAPQQSPKEIAYLGDHGIKAIKGSFGNRFVRDLTSICQGMDLVTRGRLSVQRVGEDAWAAIELMAENGGWESLDMKPKKRRKVKGSMSNVDKQGKQEETRDSFSTTKLDSPEKDRNHDNEDESKDKKRDEEDHIANVSTKRKRGTAYTDLDADDTGERLGLRRSSRAKK